VGVPNQRIGQPVYERRVVDLERGIGCASAGGVWLKRQYSIKGQVTGGQLVAERVVRRIDKRRPLSE